MTTLNWNALFSDTAQVLQPSPTRELYKYAFNTEIISLAGGLPAGECFPVAELEAASARVLQKYPYFSLQYAHTQGEAVFLKFLSEEMHRLGVNASTEQIMVSSSAMQALDLLCKLFINPGDGLGVEDPTYSGALMGFRPYRPHFVNIPTDEDGLMVDALEAKLKAGEKIRFLYMMSSFQNPMGTTLSPERQVRLVELAELYGFVIVEDDPYGELVYEGERPRPLAAVDVARNGELSHVIYVGTFSKTIAPGLRMGWIAAPKEVIGKIILAKQAMDLHSPPFNQYLIHETCKDGFLPKQILRIREINRMRRDAMLEAMDEFMPDSTHWNKPKGGMFVWVTLPEAMNGYDLLKKAIEQKVTFVPGSSYYAYQDVHNAIRLSFTQPTPEEIVEAIRRVGNAVKEMERVAV
jgi:2-aminoadipate transaminase